MWLLFSKTWKYEVYNNCCLYSNVAIQTFDKCYVSLGWLNVVQRKVFLLIFHKLLLIEQK